MAGQGGVVGHFVQAIGGIDHRRVELAIGQTGFQGSDQLPPGNGVAEAPNAFMVAT